ncbi:transporter substrate-binding domain-containing protein [Nitrospirillum amazonense]|uniref:Amino acid ABC transporter substrate-binding protein (PAAT family) n=1 Tax=Nitrospirillum amazonense TaxID=28077 RepID=A0A560J3V5_9PROT|nr:transporter substrate-binding domain-containing protein [Nitrospirillum amazonense]MDG3439061.1 transporter substrate-binding domain-containing protein [Nitrospirillum amazonense]TWB65928.1 amino acid ABC transporter substrate-binding protein (PAAT family) [Nitrospirillum amazonense]
MSKTLRGAVLGLAILLSLQAARAADVPAQQARRTVVIGTEGAFPPWNMTRPDGSLIGFEPDLLQVLCQRANLQCQLVAQDWDGMIGALQAHKIDVIADALQITPARKAVLAFSLPYAITTGVFVTQKDSPLARMANRGLVLDLDASPAPERQAQALAALREELRGKTLGVAISSTYDAFLDKYLAGVITIKSYRTMGERDLDLLSGRIDLTLDDTTYLRPLLAAPDAQDLVLVGPELIGGELGAGEGFGLRQDDTALAERLNAAIRSAVADGTVKRLSLKWFKADATPDLGPDPTSTPSGTPKP